MLFGTGNNQPNTNMNKQNTVSQGNTVPQNTSPNNPKFNFNFEDAWKA